MTQQLHSWASVLENGKLKSTKKAAGQMPLAVLFIKAKPRKHHRCPPMCEWTPSVICENHRKLLGKTKEDCCTNKQTLNEPNVAKCDKAEDDAPEPRFPTFPML